MSAGCISSSNLNLITLRCGSGSVISGSAIFGSGSITFGSGSIISVLGSAISGSVIAGSGSIISGSGMLSPNALAKSLSLSSKNSSSNKAKSN